MIWRLTGGLGVFVALGLLVWSYGQARFAAGELAERDRWRVAEAKGLAAMHKAELALQRRSGEAAAAYGERIVRLQPIIQQAKETVRVYASTPDGQRACLSGERVRGIAASRDALFDLAGATAGGDAAVPSAAVAGQ